MSRTLSLSRSIAPVLALWLVACGGRADTDPPKPAQLPAQTSEQNTTEKSDKKPDDKARLSKLPPADPPIAKPSAAKPEPIKLTKASLQFRDQIRSHPSITQAIQRICEAEYRRIEARSGYFPRLNVNFSGGEKLLDETTRSDEFGGVNSPEYDGEGVNAVMTFQQTLYDWGLTRANVRGAVYQRAVSRLELMQQSEVLSADALRAALEYAAQTAILRTHTDAFNDITERVETLEARFRAGASRRSDLREAQILRIDSETAKILAQRRIEQLEKILDTNYTLSPAQAQAIAVDFIRLRTEIPPIIPAVRSVEGRRLVQQKLSIRAQDAQLRAQGLPAFQAIITGRAWDIEQDERCKPGQYDRTNPKCKTQEITANIEFDMPLYDGGARSAGRRATNAQLRSVDAEIRAHKRNHTSESRRLREDLLALNARIINQKQRIVELGDRLASVEALQARTRADPLAVIRLRFEMANAGASLYSMQAQAETTRVDALALANKLAATMGIKTGASGC